MREPRVRVEGDWVRVTMPDLANTLASIEMRIDGGWWRPAFVESGDVMVKTGPLPAGRHTWEIRSGSITRSGNFMPPAR